MAAIGSESGSTYSIAPKSKWRGQVIEMAIHERAHGIGACVTGDMTLVVRIWRPSAQRPAPSAQRQAASGKRIV